MLVKVKQHLRTLFNYAVTVISCVVIIVLGISFFSRATTVTTTIGENISTNDLIVYGNATTTGAHRVSGNLLVNGATTFNGIAYTWPSADGTSGYALVTNGSGTLSWSTVSSGSGTLNYGAAGSLVYYASSGTTATGTVSALLTWDNTNRRLGVATTSPYATLSVAGIGAFDDYVRASYFTATSTTATSTFPYLTSTQSNVGTVVGGNWQGTSIGTQYGGTGQNFSASTGLIYLNAGTASASSTIAVNVGGTGATSFTNGSIIFSNGSILTQDNSKLYWNDANNRLGVGSATTYSPLTITATNAGSAYTIPNNDSAQVTPSAGMFISTISTAPAADTKVKGIDSVMNITYTTNPSGVTHTGVESWVLVPSTNTANLSNTKIVGGSFVADNDSDSATLNTIWGIRSAVFNFGHATNMYGLDIDLNSGRPGGTSTTTNIYGIEIDMSDDATATFTNTYGVYVSTLKGSGTYTNTPVSFYSSDVNAIGLYSAGNVGIGTTSPYAKLSVVGETVSSYFTATSTTATSTFPYLTSTQSNVGTVVGGTWQGSVIGAQYGGTGQNFSGSTGFIYLNAGAASASSTIAVNVGGTGATSFTSGSLIFSNGSILTQNNANLYWDNTNARLGIGTTSPYAKLSVVGETVSSYFTATSTTATTSVSTGGLAVGTNQFIVQQNSGKIGINQISPIAWLHESVSDNNYMRFTEANGNTPRVSNAIFELDQTADYPAGDYTLVNTMIDSDLSNKEGGGGSSRFYSLKVNVDSSDSSGQIDEIYAARFRSANSATNGTQPYLMGLTLDVNCGAGGTCTTMSGNTINLTAGSGTNAYGTRVMPISNAGLTIGNIYGNYYNLDGSSAGTIGNEYAYYAGTMVLGGVTHTNTPVAFYSADTNAIGLYSAGNVGIGTTSPYAKLSVVGETVSSYFTATSTTATSTFAFNIGSPSGDLTIQTAGTTNDLLLQPYGGEVGIGTAEPRASLDVVNTIRLTSSAAQADIAAETTIGSLQFFANDDSAGAQDTAAEIRSVADTSWGGATTNYGAGLRFFTQQSDAVPLAEKMRITNTGNVGIGTTSPYAKLSVVGETVSSYFTATSTTATSTLPYLTSTQIAVTGLTAGSIPFISTGGILAQNNSNLYWDNTNTRLGISSSTPYAKLSVTNSGTGPSFIVEDAASPDNTQFIIDASGNVGIGTSTPTAKLTVQGAGTGLNQTFAVFDSANATSTFVVLDNGYVGVGTSTPWGRFSVEQGNNDTDVFIVADAGTSTPHMRINGAGITTIERLNTGPMTFETNAGAVSWINLNVDTAVATGTIESYTAQIDDVSILTIYGEAAGSGLIGTTSVGIGTTTPVGYFTINASTTAPMAALSVWNVNTAPEGPIASFWDGGTEVFKIDASGRLGIGTSTFASTLTIGTASAKVEIANGGLCVDNDGGCNASTTGRISAVSFVTAASDIAENYYSDETLTAGDIVITKGGSMVGKAPSASSGQDSHGSIIGIVSTKPGIILGLENDNPTLDMPPQAAGIYPVALAGRVPVKVNTEAGNISIGDPLSLSSEDGVAKKASEPGKIIGYALENYDGPTIQNNGQILIFIDITYWFPPDYFSADIADIADGANNAADSGNIISQSFGWVLEQFKDIGVAIADGVVSAREFVAEKITAKKAAVDALEMKDAATGEIYCVKMENGELNKILGACPEN